MKVLIIHTAYQLKSGEDAVVAEETKLLREAGVEVEVLFFNNAGGALAKMAQLPYNFSAYRATRRKLKEYQPDVVHIHNLHFGGSPSVLYAVKRSGVPLVCTLHNYRLLCPSAILFHHGKPFMHSLQSPFPWKAALQAGFRDSVPLSFWMALSMWLHYRLGTWKIPDRYIVLSKHAKEIFSQSKYALLVNRMVVKPNFSTLCKSSAEEKREGFLFVGRLSNDKGVPLLLKVFASLPYKLTLAGTGPLKEYVEEFAKSHPNITYAGSLKRDDLMVQLHRASAMVFPSLWYEGMPLTIIEALGCGLPVIATKLGAMEYMITPEHDGLLFEAGNEDELRAAVVQWASLTEAERDVYSRNARATYEAHYTPERNAEQLLKIYGSLREVPQTPVLAAAT